MIKFLVHISDIHLRLFRQHEEYSEVFDNLISDIEKLVKGYSRDEIRIVIAGDLVHNKTNISSEQLMLAIAFLSNLEFIAPLIVIAGNHDLNLNNTERMDSITPMIKFMKGKEVQYFTESECYLDDNVVWCVYSISKGNTRPPIEAARENFGSNARYVGLFHGPLNGMKTDIGYEIEGGYDLDIFEGCDMVLCGDIHIMSGFVYKDIPIKYSSSLIQQNFGEKLGRHGFLVWDVETKTNTEHFVENKYGMYHFRITSLEDLENNNEKLINI